VNIPKYLDCGKNISRVYALLLRVSNAVSANS